MHAGDQYELVDFGHNEKLESFGGTIVRRETPAGFGKKQTVEPWSSFDLRYQLRGKRGDWTGNAPDPWCVRIGKSSFLLRKTPTGQVGIFPEQTTNWRWIEELPLDLTNSRALNLFAYTGGTTMALARRGAEVTHIDGARSVVNWARLNAAESGLADATIRWIVEDALTFVNREIRRGRQYEIIVADPPSFGRGPKGEAWKIQRDFSHLIEQLAILTRHNPALILVSCHTPGIDRSQLSRMVNSAFQTEWATSHCFDLSIESSLGNRLPAGICFRASKP